MENNRDHQLLHLRPEIASINFQAAMTGEEAFQNAIIRPILKLQNDLLLAVFIQYLQDHQVKFSSMNRDEREAYIANAIQKDNQLRGQMQGIVIGHFTLDEWQLFVQHKKPLTKRLLQMLVQRLQNQTGEIARKFDID